MAHRSGLPAFRLRDAWSSATAIAIQERAERCSGSVRRLPYRDRMDPEWYDRKEQDALKKVAAATKKRGDLEADAAKFDKAALNDETGAASTSSDSTRRSKLRSAESNRKRATEKRTKAAEQTVAASKSQNDATRARKDAADERAKRAKRDADQAKRDQDKARRDSERAAHERGRLDARTASDLSALSSQTADLTDRTADLEAALAQSRREAPPHVTVLMIAGTPEGGEKPLRLDREAREIDKKVQASRYRDQVSVTSAQAARIADLIDALNRHEPDVVHFSGHGAETVLLFDGPSGTPIALHGDQLATLLQTAPRRIRLMVFNACNSAAMAEAATQWADFAVGMERPIDDEAAKEWSGQFYGSLASGQPVQRAFDQALAHATVLTSAEAAGRPQLFAAAHADPATTVLVQPPAEQDGPLAA